MKSSLPQLPLIVQNDNVQNAKSKIGESTVRGHRNEDDDYVKDSNKVTSFMINVEVKMINEWRPIQFKYESA